MLKVLKSVFLVVVVAVEVVVGGGTGVVGGSGWNKVMGMAELTGP